MSRTYSDPSYGSKKTVVFGATGSLVGTGTGTTKVLYTFMNPATVTDWNLYTVVGGTTAALNVLIGKSLAGTGAVVAFGTQAVGTTAAGVVVDCSVTATSFSTGDDLAIQWAGTSAMTTNVIPSIQYTETFVVTDN